MDTFELKHISKDSPESLSLFERAYHEILAPAFPDASQAETLDKFMAGLHGEIANFDVVANIIGHQLRNTDKAELAGISVAYYYPKHNVSVLAYNAISPDIRQGGLGKAMVHSRIESLKDKAAQQGKSLRAVFLEVNNPERAPRELDSMDPHKRVAIFEKWGARKIDINYVQPPVCEEGTFCDYMDLYSYPVNGRYANREDVRDFLKASFCLGYGSTRERQTLLRQIYSEMASWQPEKPLPKSIVAGYHSNIPMLHAT